MSAAFTPGPWIALKDRHNEFYLIDTALGQASTNGTVIADDIRGEQRHANARLIAAAPELYAAIEELLEASLGWSNDAATRALNLLAKARGEQ